VFVDPGAVIDTLRGVMGEPKIPDKLVSEVVTPTAVERVSVTVIIGPYPTAL